MSESPVRSVEHAAQTRSHWLDDSSVAHCQDESCGGAFSAMLRRHHCRFCGGIFCSKCLQYITLRTSAKAKKPFRACKDCLQRYQKSCFEVPLRLGSTQRALPEDDARVAAFRAQKTKGWGAALPSWGAPAPVFECKVFVQPADKGADPRSLVPFLTSVTFDLKPGLRTPREKHVQGSPYELEFLADAKGECKMTLAFKDGDQIHRHQVPLKPGADAQAETARVWNVCVDQTFQLEGSELPRSPGPRGLITGATTAVGKIIGRVSVNSDSSEPVDTGQLDNWLEENADQEETPEQKAHRFAEAAAGRSLTPPRRRDPEPEPEQQTVGHYTKQIFFRVEKRSQLDPNCEPSVGGQRRWLEEGAVVEVLETKWLGDDECPTQRVRTVEGWATAVHGTTKYLRRDRQATRPCAAPASQASNGVEVDDSVEGDLVREPQLLDESLPTAAAGVERSVSQQLERDRQLVADQKKQRAERERLENEERLVAAQRKREEAEEKRKARAEADEKEKARVRALEAEKRAEQEREARRLEMEKAERMAREAKERAAQREEEARRKAEEQRVIREEEERAAEEALAREAAERAAAKQKSAALKRERAKLQREREGKGGTLLVSVGHLSLVDDDIGAYVPFLKINCDHVVSERSVNGGQHRAICPPEHVPFRMPGGTDFVFAVQPSCKHFMLDLWDQSMLGARFNSVLGSKQVPLHRIRCADSVWPDHYEASALGGMELPRDSGTWSALSEEFELKDAKSGKTKGKMCLTMRWAPWPDEGGPEDEQIQVEFKEAGPLGKR